LIFEVGVGGSFWKIEVKKGTHSRRAAGVVVCVLHAVVVIPKAVKDFSGFMSQTWLSRASSMALVIAQSSKMPRAFRLMRFELEWFEGKPLPPSFHVLRRSVGIQSALDWTR
jgi:hypothetical protein